MRAGNVECQSIVAESYIQPLESLHVLQGDLQLWEKQGGGEAVSNMDRVKPLMLKREQLA